MSDKTAAQFEAHWRKKLTPELTMRGMASGVALAHSVVLQLWFDLGKPDTLPFDRVRDAVAGALAPPALEIPPARPEFVGFKVAFGNWGRT